MLDSDVFRAGVAPGGPTTQEEVKMLICYILTKIARPMSFEQIYEALQENGLVNYFELVRAIEKLMQSGHIHLRQEDGIDSYVATGLGVDAARYFANALPLSVREKAVQASERLFRRKEREQEVHVEATPAGGGYLLEFSIPDAGNDLISFAVFAPTAEMRDRLTRRFLNCPMFIYKGVMALLSGDENLIGEIFPHEEEPLF